ncbi:hypothetical protein GGR52DRAFT_224935 [Hypoxylon sp. FL1284]|nr:hypothetical protein GGR52DRAFT_256294 [Hypoxylon sp. FL1284]KAI0180046.1 hypothetical protein GGR52DRAFT_224935 [Hypoxylon sp. FL1284]
MADWKGIVKKGWHPEKEGTTLKGQVKGLVGRGDSSSSQSSSSRSAAPISTLRDPSTFAPPPKRGASPASPQYSGSATSQQQTAEPQAEHRPYKVDTTGLSTSHLPPPPPRRDSPDRQQPLAPPPYSAAKPSGPPSLPPRLPPRGGNASPTQTQSTGDGSHRPGAGDGYLNQGAVNRLGAAGLSVPGLGIGKTSTSATAPPPRSPTAGASPTPQQGSTTWAEKRAAVETASSLRKDSSTWSPAEVRAADTAACELRQKYGGKVAEGMLAAGGLRQERFVGGSERGTSSTTPMSTYAASPAPQIADVVAKKKPMPPPPPPPKKKHLAGAASDGDVPPPVPVATKPSFN